MKYNKKILQYDPYSIWNKLRIWVFKRRNKKEGGFTVKCGCGECNKKVIIFVGDNWIEINGVISSKKEWSDLLLPALKQNKDKP